MSNWGRVRRHYENTLAAILAADAFEWAIDAYAWEHDAGISMTPIEAWMWNDIRALGMVMYPQFPVGRYFVDFANPRAKVAIECDGEAFHRDAGKDAKRQAYIEGLGWVVYRFTGKECRTDSGYSEDESGAYRFKVGDCYLRMREIADRHSLRFVDDRTSVVEPYHMEAL